MVQKYLIADGMNGSYFVGDKKQAEDYLARLTDESLEWTEVYKVGEKIKPVFITTVRILS